MNPIWGWHAGLAVLSNSARVIKKICVTEVSRRRLPRSYQDRARLEVWTKSEISSSLPRHAVHQDLVVWAEPLPALSLTAQTWPGNLWILAADQITDPQNMGGLFRVAAAWGAWGLLQLAHRPLEAWGAMTKAASGAYEIVHDVHVPHEVRSLKYLQSQGFWIIGLSEKGDVPLPVARERYGHGRSILVVGAEGKGLRPSIQQCCDVMVALPTQKAFSTLNVTAAASVGAYALYGQDG